MKMVRKQVYITQEQDEKLKRLAESRGVTEAEVIRGAIDNLREVVYESAETVLNQVREVALMERYVAETQEARGRVWEGRVLDEQAWREELAFMKSLAARGGGTGEAYKWNREDAYDKRRMRLPD